MRGPRIIPLSDDSLPVASTRPYACQGVGQRPDRHSEGQLWPNCPIPIEGLNFSASDQNTLIVELIIPPQSSLIGERLLDTHLQGDPNAHIIAIKRRNLHYSAQKIQFGQTHGRRYHPGSLLDRASFNKSAQELISSSLKMCITKLFTNARLAGQF